jgi:hypothetical protein
MFDKLAAQPQSINAVLTQEPFSRVCRTRNGPQRARMSLFAITGIFDPTKAISRSYLACLLRCAQYFFIRSPTALRCAADIFRRFLLRTPDGC